MNPLPSGNYKNNRAQNYIQKQLKQPDEVEELEMTFQLVLTHNENTREQTRNNGPPTSKISQNRQSGPQNNNWL